MVNLNCAPSANWGYYNNYTGLSSNKPAASSVSFKQNNDTTLKTQTNKKSAFWGFVGGALAVGAGVALYCLTRGKAGGKSVTKPYEAVRKIHKYEQITLDDITQYTNKMTEKYKGNAAKVNFTKGSAGLKEKLNFQYQGEELKINDNDLIAMIFNKENELIHTDVLQCKSWAQDLKLALGETGINVTI